jgi:hypothetical protein
VCVCGRGIPQGCMRAQLTCLFPGPTRQHPAAAALKHPIGQTLQLGTTLGHMVFLLGGGEWKFVWDAVVRSVPQECMRVQLLCCVLRSTASATRSSRPLGHAATGGKPGNMGHCVWTERVHPTTRVCLGGGGWGGCLCDFGRGGRRDVFVTFGVGALLHMLLRWWSQQGRTRVQLHYLFFGGGEGACSGCCGGKHPKGMHESAADAVSWSYKATSSASPSSNYPWGNPATGRYCGTWAGCCVCMCVWGGWGTPCRGKHPTGMHEGAAETLLSM